MYIRLENLMLNYNQFFIVNIGVLLWEISSRKSPFSTEEYDIDLAIEISQGLREEPILNTSENYIRLYKGCWDESDVVARREVRNQINTNFRQNRNLANEIIGNSVFVRGHEEDIEQQLQIGIPIWIEMYFPEVTRDEIPSQYQGMTRR
ncbi:unnamed protein product [Rhizophagus irregularis]|nr:unnamed protein product [Rhizophagus irregularis]